MAASPYHATLSCRRGSTNGTWSSGDYEQGRGGGAPSRTPGTTFHTSTFTSTWRWDGEGGDTPAVLLDSCLGHAEVSPRCQNEFATELWHGPCLVGGREAVGENGSQWRNRSGGKVDRCLLFNASQCAACGIPREQPRGRARVH